MFYIASKINIQHHKDRATNFFEEIWKQFAVVTGTVLLAVSLFLITSMEVEDFISEGGCMMDITDSLTDEEIAELSDILDEISYRQKMDVAIITTEDMGEYTNIVDYADNLHNLWSTLYLTGYLTKAREEDYKANSRMVWLL